VRSLETPTAGSKTKPSSALDVQNLRYASRNVRARNLECMEYGLGIVPVLPLEQTAANKAVNVALAQLDSDASHASLFAQPIVTYPPRAGGQRFPRPSDASISLILMLRYDGVTRHLASAPAEERAYARARNAQRRAVLAIDDKGVCVELFGLIRR